MKSYLYLHLNRIYEKNPGSWHTVPPVLSGHSKLDKTKILMTNDSLMKAKSIAECSSWSILQYFCPALSDNRSWKTILGLLLEWPLKTGFTVFLIKDLFAILW